METSSENTMSTQPQSKSQTDRYVSFCGIECDRNANEFMQKLENHITQGHGDPRWQEYFRQKREQQAKMKQDNLYFVGAQMNNLYAYLEGLDDAPLHDMLWDLEQECC